MKRVILLRYHEVALKGDNRDWFEERLMHNARKLLRRALRVEPGADDDVSVSRQHGRIVVTADWDRHEAAIRGAIAHLFGSANWSPARVVPTNLDALTAAAIEETRAHLDAHGAPGTFRVRVRRTERAFPESSQELDRIIGGRVKAEFPQLNVGLKDPDFTLGIELRFGDSYVWTEKINGAKGLPVGSNGRLLALLSGGLDSPIAAIGALSRGATVAYLHFHGAPFVGEEVLDKLDDLVRAINRFQPDPQPLSVVPFGKIQERVALATHPKLRTLLYRRLMFRIACAFAPQQKARALVTGECLGQVASQTLENLATIDDVATLPVLRPLITTDKEEIIEQAKRWGTYDISIRPGADCCTLFADRHPAIRCELKQIEAEEAKLPIDELVREAVAGVQLRRVY